MNGNGTYSTPSGFAPTTAGNYEWAVNYSGDANNNPAAAASLSTLTTFNGSNGETPDGGVILDSAGNLYGMTAGGGAFGEGTIFELAKGSNTDTVLASFDDTDGEYPEDSLIMDSAGNLYGTAESGGASGDGTIFELAKGSSTITVLASFTGSNGANPFGRLVMDSSGNVYGTTWMAAPQVWAQSLSWPMGAAPSRRWRRSTATPRERALMPA